jgi:hypothetical protein
MAQGQKRCSEKLLKNSDLSSLCFFATTPMPRLPNFRVYGSSAKFWGSGLIALTLESLGFKRVPDSDVRDVVDSWISHSGSRLLQLHCFDGVYLC